MLLTKMKAFGDARGLMQLRLARPEINLGGERFVDEISTETDHPSGAFSFL